MIRTVAICGGGPSGLAAAIALQQVGLEVAVYDTAIPPIDKACGEGLLPDGLTALRRLGVHLGPDIGHPVRGIRFHHGRSVAVASFGEGSALGLRRTVLHQTLIQRATELGVRLRWGQRYIVDDASDLVVGADGIGSQVRQKAGLDCASQTKRFGFRQHFQVAPFSPYVEVYWRGQAQVYVTPIAADEIGVAVVSRDPHYRLAHATREFPEVHERLQGAQPLSDERGALSATRRLPRLYRDKVVLVGDASGSVDVITGEGVGLAFREALALAEAVRSGNLELYAKAHRSITSRARLMSRVLLVLSQHPSLQSPAVMGLSMFPGLFSRLLAFHVGS